MLNNIFGKRLKKSREKLGFTQKQLADKINVSSSTVGMYEQGRREPSYDLLLKISDTLKISVLELLGIESEFYIKSVSIENAINNLIRFIKNQDDIIFKGEKLGSQDINVILCVLKMLIK